MAYGYSERQWFHQILIRKRKYRGSENDKNDIKGQTEGTDLYPTLRAEVT